MKLIFSYIGKYPKRFSLSIFLLMLEALCDLLLPTLMALIIDKGVADKDLSSIFKFGIIMFGVALVGGCLAFCRNILSSFVAQRIGADMRMDLYTKIQGLSFDTMNKLDKASLITRLTNDVMIVQNFITGLMRIFVRAPLTGIGSVIMAFILNPRLALILCIVIPCIAVLIYANVTLSFPLFSKVQKQLDKVNGVVREYLSGVRVVRAFNRFDYETMRLSDANQQYTETSIKVNRVMAFFSPTMSLTLNLGIITVLWLGGFQVNNGDIYVGQMVAFINYMTQILFSLMMINFVFNSLIRAKASALRISEVLTQESIHYPDSLIEEDMECLEFSDVSFTYNQDSSYVLQNISFHCNQGDTIGIIGSIGSGKSTLLQLIPRFYDVTTGAITLNNRNITQYSPAFLRGKIAMVPQKSALLSGSILENIRYGNEDATFEEVVAVAKIAQVHDFILTLPNGYDSIVGQKGVNLSGGQKQRISIARALIRKPEILLLDDCTSAIDVLTEQKILSGLKEYCKGITIFLISQRISTIKEADCILVLDYGKLENNGKHEHLLAHSSVYREIYESQTGKEVAYE